MYRRNVSVSGLILEYWERAASESQMYFLCRLGLGYCSDWKLIKMTWRSKTWTQDVNWTYIERSENVRDRYEVYFSLFEVLQKKKKEMPRIKCHTPPPYFQNTPPLILPILLFLWEKNWTSTLWKNYGISKPLCKGRDVSPHNLYNFLLFSTDIWRTWHSEGYLVIVTISYSLIWFRIHFFFIFTQ